MISLTYGNREIKEIGKCKMQIKQLDFGQELNLLNSWGRELMWRNVWIRSVKELVVGSL